MRILNLTLINTLVIIMLTTVQLFANQNFEKMIKEKTKQLALAYESGDLDQILSFYTKDIVYMPDYNDKIMGITDLKEFLKSSQEAGFKLFYLSFETSQLVDNGDLIYEIGNYYSSVMRPEIPHPIKDSGKYLNIWQKQADNKLKIKICIWNTNKNPWTMIEELSDEFRDWDPPYAGMIRNESIDGIIYYLPRGVYGTGTSLENTFRYTFDQYVLEVMDKHLKLNGKDFGTVKKGDEIMITKKGELFLNKVKLN